MGGVNMLKYFFLLLLFVVPLALALNSTNTTNSTEDISVIVENISLNNSQDNSTEEIIIESLADNTTSNQTTDLTVEETQPSQNSLNSGRLQPLRSTVAHDRKSFSMPGIKADETCVQKQWETIEDVRGQCEHEITCNPTNTSCTPRTEIYECRKNTRIVTNTQEVCTPQKLTIQEKYALSVDGYTCTPTSDAGTITLICDSKTDGNGDGICQSGESCQKFEVRNGQLYSYQKNSREDFIENDRTFNQQPIQVEVLK